MKTRSWQCPACDALFVQKNMSHSCVRRTVEEFLADKPARGVELYRYFLNEYKKIGPIIEHAVKTRIAFMVEVRFSGVSKIGADHIEGTFWLKEHIESPKFYRVEHLGVSDYIHRFRIRDESDIDDEFRRNMQMSYEIGQRKHIRRR